MPRATRRPKGRKLSSKYAERRRRRKTGAYKAERERERRAKFSPSQSYER